MARFELKPRRRSGTAWLALLALAIASSGAPCRPALAEGLMYQAADCRGTAKPSIDPLELIELQISYSTLIARYYKPVDPAAVVSGAHRAIQALIAHCGVTDHRKLVANPRQDGSERIDTDFLTALSAYGRRVSVSGLISAAIAGELDAMSDPYTELFRKPEFKQFDNFLAGERFGGVGLVLDASDTRPKVATVLPGGPAERAGMQSGDVIDTIDGIDTVGKSPDALRGLLRGKAGTTAALTIVRREPGSGRDSAGGRFIDQTQQVSVVREILTDPQTISRMLPGAIGYIQLTRFGDDAAGEVGRALTALESRGATRFILDLRDNGGGYGDAATGVASLFVSGGTIFSTRERTGPAQNEKARGTSTFHAPLAVLVNYNTASAAEIVAGALQDDHAATIVGAPTFGKGVVQSVFPLPDGAAIKMTTARYYTPSGRSIDGHGIRPDDEVAEPRDAHLGDPANDPQLASAIAIVNASSPAPGLAEPFPTMPSVPAPVATSAPTPHS